MSDFSSGVEADQWSINSFTHGPVDLLNAIITHAGPSSSNATINRAYIIPLHVTKAYTVRGVFWANGSTVTDTIGNLGIYTLNFNRIYVTAETPLVGTVQLQVVTVEPALLLPPGKYYLAYSTTGPSSANRIMQQTISPAQANHVADAFMQDSAFPLPAKLNPERMTTNSTGIILGLTNRAGGVVFQ